MDSLFDDGKDAQALRTIGEVSQALGIPTHVLRYWEQQFSMLRPLKRSGNRRYYRTDDVALVRTIDRLVNREGYTLKGAHAAIRSGKEAPAAAIARERATTPSQPAMGDSNLAKELLPQLKALRSRLASALEA